MLCSHIPATGKYVTSIMGVARFFKRLQEWSRYNHWIYIDYIIGHQIIVRKNFKPSKIINKNKGILPQKFILNEKQFANISMT